jgi:ABC-type Mn2+/Zn2+ transport system permease subunit
MELTEILRTLVRDFPYAMYGSILTGMVCAFLGVFIVARRVVFFGAVLTQVSVMGLAITFLPFVHVPHTIGSLVITLGSVLIMARLLTGKKVPKDAVLGFAFVSSIAARILIVQNTPHVEAAEIEGLLRGDVLFVTPELFYLMLGAFLLTGVAYFLFYKQFTYVSVDPETARTQGFHASFWDTAFYLLTGLVISFATHMVGDVFVFGFLVAPAMAALLLGRRVRQVLIISVVIGALAPALGLVLAFALDMPASPSMVAVASAVLAGAWGWSVVRRGSGG